MVVETFSDLSARAAIYRALGDPRRLQIVDALMLSDRSVSELIKITGMSSSLLAFHLDSLEEAHVTRRQVSEGDARRRYVTLAASLPGQFAVPPAHSASAGTADPSANVLFVCTANSARSQLAAGLWHSLTGRTALSAGIDPAPTVHPMALQVAARHGLNLVGASTRHVDEVVDNADLVVSVCDRAHEQGLSADTSHLHWSVPDPVQQGIDAFEEAFAEIESRVHRLALVA